MLNTGTECGTKSSGGCYDHWLIPMGRRRKWGTIVEIYCQKCLFVKISRGLIKNDGGISLCTDCAPQHMPLCRCGKPVQRKDHKNCSTYCKKFYEDVDRRVRAMQKRAARRDAQSEQLAKSLDK